MGGRGPVSGEKAAWEAACRDLVTQSRVAGDSRAHSEDVAQDACVRALGMLEPARVRDPVRYLVGIARNLFIDRKRNEQRAARLRAQLGHRANAGDTLDPERILAGKQSLDRVLGAIDSLPPRCREAFALHRFDGLSYAAVARRMGVSTGTVEKHIAEAMLRITRSLASAEEIRS
jgi:RNA polymerase sigma-70 factor (ECF subfamily)